MANCLITTGWAQDCAQNAGGLKRVLIANLSMVAEIAPVPGAVGDDGIVTTINMETLIGSPTAIAKFFEFRPNKMSSKFDETESYNAQNGTYGWEQVITLMFAKNEAAKRNQIKLMAGSDLIAIVQDFNGKYWLVGEFNGLNLSGANSSTGTALSDMNGWTLTLTGQTNEPAREVDPTLIQNLLDGVANA